ncbi:HNH endonuclease [Pseudanabaena sp. FACHB-2040]|uniref:HNH endonuclease n=1 Tax=Pseudanabaena sp. FACHB-2040 TaxID=2692859 RepID=UPI0016861B83|nr:HNH endonuclease [Pseudanabaena sp. FACHB-2040]MBD2256362.1 HNH endonuclease [Pseudanabaena sp. FACHB-2040]
MTDFNPQELATLYSSADINELWQAAQNCPVIDHPNFGKISPNQYRAKYHQKPCPFCGQKMVHGKSAHSTNDKQEAIARGYQYLDGNDKKTINKAGKTYFHPHYVTLDHKLNKARCPERMFDCSNLQIMCWKCNNLKGDNNAFEIQHNLSYLQDLAEGVLHRYPLL